MQRGRVYAVASTGYGRGEVKLAAARPALRGPGGSPAHQVVIAPTSVELLVERGDRLGEVRVYESEADSSPGNRLSPTAPSPEPNLAGRVSWYVSETVENLVGFFS